MHAKSGHLPEPLKSFSRPIVRPSRLIAAMVASNYPNDPVAHQAIYNAEDEWIFRERLKKLQLFAAAIDINLTTPSGAIHACFRLFDLYPEALKVVEPGSQKRRGAPRKPRFEGAPSSWYEFVTEIDLQLAVAGQLGEPTSISEICGRLSKYGPRRPTSRWRAYEDTTLETYYHEHKAALEDLRARAKLAEGPTGYWKYLEAAVESAKQNKGLLPRRR